MSDAAVSAFARLAGRQASDEEVRRLHELKDSLGLGDNDALWLVLVSLEHYDGLFRSYPKLLGAETEKALATVRQTMAAAAAAEAKAANRHLAEAVASAAGKIAVQRTQLARVQTHVLAAAVALLFGSFCLGVGYTLGAGRWPVWTIGRGGLVRLIAIALGAPAGWVVALLLVPLAGYWARAGWLAARVPDATKTQRAVGWGMLGLALVAVCTIIAVASQLSG